MTSPYTEEAMLAHYGSLCAKAQEAYKRAAPLEAELDNEVAAMEKHRVRAAELGRQIDEAWGPDHIAMKREICTLARVLSRPMGPLATIEGQPKPPTARA